jgi:protein archease
VHPVESRSFDVPGDDPAYLLLDWLNELLYAFESDRLLFAEFEVTRTRTGLHAVARGERYDPSRHALAHEVKAITYHALRVARTPEGWEATVIVDI